MSSTYSVSGGLNNFCPTWTIFGHKVAQLKDTIRAKFYPDVLFGLWFVYWKVKASDGI